MSNKETNIQKITNDRLGEIMKKLNRSLIVLMLLAGCSSSIPDWYTEPPQTNDVFYGVGDAKRPQQALSKKVATARARDEVAQAVEVKVSTMLKDFMQSSGIGENASALEFNESVSKHVAQVSMQGCIISETFIAKDGTVYVMVQYPIKQAKEETLKKAKEEIKNHEALFNEFKARQGFEALEKELNSINTTQ